MKPFYCEKCQEYKFGWQIKRRREMVAYEAYAVVDQFCKKCGSHDIKNVKHELTRLIRTTTTPINHA
jgi:hypothetical protein